MKGSKAKVVWVQVEPCNDPYDCTLLKGTDVTFKVRFVSDSVITDLSAAAYVTLATLPDQLQLAVDSGCGSAKDACGPEAGNIVTYRTQFKISDKVPNIDVYFRFELLNQNQEKLVCVRVSAHIDERPLSEKELEKFIASKRGQTSYYSA
ncbi:E1 DerP2 DerF2 domain containing protein [Trichuris trichiura]|uniref:E1 DerP2 DerF2 domain containing protein n=1 Tax=Trichuris trichiura TaxID=36087 RepID=A0A077ZIB9_TRITR|nr:E1 DerP2 DerF2 domain containing protein [Trichuris trichiura]